MRINRSTPRTSRHIAASLILAILVVVVAWTWIAHKRDAVSGTYRTAVVDRGDIRVAVSATGSLAAISTVDVGSQISGQVTEVLVDFNDRVHKGDVLARIEPQTLW